MGWFDEQIKARKEADSAVFEDSFRRIADAVMGRRMSRALNDDRRITEDAVGEILRYYHVKPQELPDSVRDMNEVLEYLLRPYGIMRRSVILSPGWYHDASGAMLGTRRDDGSVTALIPCGLNGYCFFDRKTGKTVRLDRRTQELIDTEAIAFYKPFPLKKMSMGSLAKYIVQQIAPADVALLAAASLAATLAGMFAPWLNRQLFSTVLASGSGAVLLGTAVFLICATVSSLLFGSIQTLLTSRIGTKLNNSVEAATMMRILSLQADFFKRYSSGELANRAQYVNGLCTQLTDMALTTGLTSLFSLIYIAQIFVYAPALVAPALLVTLLTLAVTAVQVVMQSRITGQEMEHAGKESGLSYQLITGIQKIRLSGAERRAFARWGRHYALGAKLKYDPPAFLNVAPVITLAISLIGTLAMYSAAVRSGVSVAEYYAFNSAYGMVNAAFTALAGIAAGAAQIKPTLETARPILEAEPEVAEDKLVLTRLSGGIELNNVTFRYTEDMPPVLDDLSLKIRPGQ
ncbi:MAG: NHLP family bacteriocin export ABC transporter permease/ATPase subunit, partial [Oscillospiraceae bacterium]|nr:NHLP family bacteriocin export ABC transporter permease/ATPase subunit [Oscillospiraceae bacterium]